VNQTIITKANRTFSTEFLDDAAVCLALEDRDPQLGRDILKRPNVADRPKFGMTILQWTPARQLRDDCHSLKDVRDIRVANEMLVNTPIVLLRENAVAGSVSRGSLCADQVNEESTGLRRL
jgi:hypothetical protein